MISTKYKLVYLSIIRESYFWVLKVESAPLKLKVIMRLRTANCRCWSKQRDEGELACLSHVWYHTCETKVRYHMCDITHPKSKRTLKVPTSAKLNPDLKKEKWTSWRSLLQCLLSEIILNVSRDFLHLRSPAFSVCKLKAKYYIRTKKRKMFLFKIFTLQLQKIRNKKTFLAVSFFFLSFIAPMCYMFTRRCFRGSHDPL